MEFHIYLDSLEKHFAAKDEKERTLHYIVKLQSSLREHISKVALSLPTNKKDMIAMSDRFRESMFKDKKRKDKKIPLMSKKTESM